MSKTSPNLARHRNPATGPQAIDSPHRRKPALTKGQLSRMRKKRKRNSVLYHEAVALAAELGVETGPKITSIPDILMMVFERTHALWLAAATAVDQLDADAAPGEPNSPWYKSLDEQGNWEYQPAKEIELERVLREELFDQGVRLSQLNIDDRAVRVQEIQLEILGAALSKAVARSNLTEDQRRELGGHLREELSLIEGTAKDHEPAGPNTGARSRAEANAVAG